MSGIDNQPPEVLWTLPPPHIFFPMFRYNYLTRMASIIYQVEELTTLNEIAEIVSEFELEEEFSKVN